MIDTPLSSSPSHSEGGDVFSLVGDLVARHSITPDDAGCLDFIASRLAPIGFVCERMDANGVSNLWARRGQTKPLVCFAGHTDVVPPGARDQWHSDPFVPTVREGFLVGRGTADMKTSVAAFIVAVERFLHTYPDHPGSIAFLLTSDEEGDAVDGTVRVIEALQTRHDSIDFCIVGEPTCATQLGDTLKNGRRGSLSGKLTVFGRQGHVAYPDRVKNPIHLVAPAIVELSTTRWDEGNAYFPPTSFQISNIHSGTGASNVVPGVLEMCFNLRFSTASTAESLRLRIQSLLDRHQLDYTLDWTLGGKPFLTPSGQLVTALSAAIETITGLTPALSTSGGTSDGRFIADICPEVVEFGPLNTTIHQVNECVAIADLEPLTRIYEETLKRLLTP